MPAEADDMRGDQLAAFAAAQQAQDADAMALTARLVREIGGLWSAGLNGSTVAMRDMKGLHYVHLLLRRPGEDVPAPDLSALVAGRGSTQGHLGELAGGSTERARVAVRKAIVAALDRIAEQDPALGRLLRDTVRTGAICRYEPDPGRPVQWTLDARRAAN